MVKAATGNLNQTVFDSAIRATIEVFPQLRGVDIVTCSRNYGHKLTTTRYAQFKNGIINLSGHNLEAVLVGLKSLNYKAFEHYLEILVKLVYEIDPPCPPSQIETVFEDISEQPPVIKQTIFDISLYQTVNRFCVLRNSDIPAACRNYGYRLSNARYAQFQNREINLSAQNIEAILAGIKSISRAAFEYCLDRMLALAYEMHPTASHAKIDVDIIFELLDISDSIGDETLAKSIEIDVKKLRRIIDSTDEISELEKSRIVAFIENYKASSIEVLNGQQGNIKIYGDLNNQKQKSLLT